MTSKSKKDKIKQGNQKDFDLLYDVLVNGGTYSDYRSELLDRSMPQEQLNFDISEDDILAAWILGKDEESELYVRGGYMHQDQPWMLNPNNKGIGLLLKDLNQNSFTSGASESDYTPTGLYSSDSGHNYTAGIPYVQQFDSLGGLGFNVAANANGASDDPYAKFIMGDMSGGFLQQMLSQKSSLREGANYIKSLELNFGVGDNAYLAQQYNQMQPIARSTMNADAVDTWKWIFDPSGIMHSWGLIDYDASEGLDYLNLIAEQVENRNKQNFNTAVTNSNKLNLWNQLSQPYMAACGGKMKNKLASGGYINSHYDYITDPLVRVEAGGTHQENPNEGVLTSIAPDGQPNLVEEGETIINNGQEDAYVFSDRIVADDEILKSHLLPNKFAGKTYADISKELDKIIEEHKNDEISKRTFDEMISRLQQAQEDQKFKEKQEEVEKFLDGLTDEQKEQLEQTMVDEAQAEQQAAEEQAITEQQAQELAAQEQQMQPEQASEQAPMEQPEELVTPSRYDQMMSRALFADAANLGMFGLGGHLHQDEISWMKRNYINNYGMRRDAKTGNLFFDPLVRQVIVSDDPRVAEIAKETNDNYIQAGLMGLDMASAINAANLAAKSSSAASALNKASTASKTFSKEADKAIRGFIHGKNSVSPLTLINASVNQAGKASNLRNTAGNIYDLYTSANQARNVIGGVNSVTQPLVATYGTSRNIPISQDSENLDNEVVVYDYSDLMPWYTFDNYQETPTKKPSVKNLIEYEYSGIPGITNEIQGYSGLLRTNKQDENSSIKTSPSSYKEDVLNYVQDKNSNITIGRWTSSGKYKPGTTYFGLNKKDKASFDEYYKNSQLVPELEPIGLPTPEEAFDRLGSRSFGNTSSSTSTATTDSGNNDTNSTNESTTDYSAWLRYAPAIGSGIQYLSDLFGITNRNDYTNPNLFQRSINLIPNVGFTPLGGYRTFNPFDETYQLNALRSMNDAARRAVINNANGNYGATLAALNALNYNTSGQFGDLALKAREYNEKERQAVDEYNLKINQINSTLSMTAQEKNQAIAALKARLTAALAEMRQQIEDNNDAAKSANMTNFYHNLGNVGKENFNMTMVRSNPAFYYTITDDGHILYKNGFDGLNERDQSFVRSVAEPQAEEQRKKRLEEANKKADEAMNPNRTNWLPMMYSFGRPSLFEYRGLNDRRN